MHIDRLRSAEPRRNPDGHWKTVIGSKLKGRTFNNQKTEANIGVRVLNRMTELGRPHFERIA